jgi:hypothetical protein
LPERRHGQCHRREFWRRHSSDGWTEYKRKSNYIGVGANGTLALGSRDDGIEINGANNSVVGHNVIANNGDTGVSVQNGIGNR